MFSFTSGEDGKEARWGEESDWLAGLTSGLLARGLETRDLGPENPPSLLAILCTTFRNPVTISVLKIDHYSVATSSGPLLTANVRKAIYL
jgi:hypothetical protein